jgi:hypothetical protein
MFKNIKINILHILKQYNYLIIQPFETASFIFILKQHL